MFITENSKALIKVSIDVFNKHTIMILSRKHMIIELQKIDHLFKHSKEFAVLVEDKRMANVWQMPNCIIIFINADA